MHTKEKIIKQLREMGVPQDRIVLVHSSLRRVGKTEDGADGIIDALKSHICSNGGLLCIPTHTWANLGKNDLITLDLTEGNTCIGTLPNVAAKRADACRSLHPTHSMAVFGDGAKDFVEGEDKATTPTPPNTCYGKIYDTDGYILLVGVGHNKNTYLHCVEEMLDVPNRLDPEPREVTVKHYSGLIEKRFSRGHRADGIEDVSAQFPNYEPAFRYHGCITDGFIGDAPTQLCSARKMKQVMELIYRRSGGKELLDKLAPIPIEYYEGELENG
jgi:aminoglycoside 3-N-acetyltransferase